MRIEQIREQWKKGTMPRDIESKEREKELYKNFEKERTNERIEYETRIEEPDNE